MKHSARDPKPDTVRQIEMLAESARLLAERGEILEAEKVYREIAAVAPYHIPALNFLATQALRRGEHATSKAYLETALRADSSRPILHQNLALAHRAGGELDQALAALERATALDPELRTAHLHKGAVLEDMGRNEEAIISYWRAWRLFPVPELLANPGIAPAHLRSLSMHAARQIQSAQLRLFEQALQPLYARHGNASLAKVEAAARGYTGIETPTYQHPLQRPAFLYLPGISPQPFFERGTLPILGALEARSRDVRTELTTLLENPVASLAPYVLIDAAVTPPEWRSLNGSASWSSFHLYKAGTPDAAHLARCPVTAAVLQNLPLPMIDMHAPEAFFSILQPGTHIPPHHGLGNYKLVVHLPLLIPNHCAIRVGGEIRTWQENECLVFDDSFRHEAWNRSDSVRAVLILDAWNPLVTEAEREGISALVSAIGEFRRGYCGTM